MDTSTGDVLIDVKDLHFKRGDQTIFAGFNMQLMRGKVTAIMGPSGTGKTTLLKLMSGQLKPSGGTIRVMGKDLSGLSRKDLFTLRKQMGMLFQSGALLSDLNVFDNVAYPLREHSKLSEALIRDLVLMKLNAVGLRAASTKMPTELSGGMARRVALARAIALDPQLVLYDEPFTGQDPISMGVLTRLIRSFNDALGLSSVIVSHDVAETCSIADYIYLTADGGVKAHGSPDELLASSDPWVRQFMHGLDDGPVAFHQAGPSLADELLGAQRGGL